MKKNMMLLENTHTHTKLEYEYNVGNWVQKIAQCTSKKNYKTITFKIFYKKPINVFSCVFENAKVKQSQTGHLRISTTLNLYSNAQDVANTAFT